MTLPTFVFGPVWASASDRFEVSSPSVAGAGTHGHLPGASASCHIGVALGVDLPRVGTVPKRPRTRAVRQIDILQGSGQAVPAITDRRNSRPDRRGPTTAEIPKACASLEWRAVLSNRRNWKCP